MDTNRKIAEKFTKKLPRSLIVKLLLENIFIERLGFSHIEFWVNYELNDINELD